MTQPLRIFIGYDSREPVAYHVLAHSLLRQATRPVSILPLVQSHLRAAGIYTRALGPTETTEFSLTRFLVPYLSGYQGRSVFCDCDMLARTDITQLWELVQGAAVWICPHAYVPKTAVKMDGQLQTVYPRKNWSSFMVFENARCRVLTPDYVNTATGLALHRFQWLDDAAFGYLALDWNWLIGEYAPNPHAQMLHYTLGGPWFRDYQDCDGAALWRQEYGQMTEPVRAGLSSKVAVLG